MQRSDYTILSIIGFFINRTIPKKEECKLNLFYFGRNKDGTLKNNKNVNIYSNNNFKK